MEPIKIHPDIKKAHTLPASFYNRQDIFEEVKEKIFARSWLYLCDVTDVKHPNRATPFNLLPGVLDEPILISCDKNGQLHCLSNVCTHRGKILVENTCNTRILSCGYHGRCFSMDGSFRSMPAFDTAENFQQKQIICTKYLLKNGSEKYILTSILKQVLKKFSNLYKTEFRGCHLNP